MPQEESKPVDPSKEADQAAEAVKDLSVSDEPKQSKKDKIKNAISSVGSSSSKDASSTSTETALPAEFIDRLTPEQLNNILATNPALRSILPAGTSDQKSIKEALKKVNAAELMTGMSKGKNAKDMASHRFWSTQPVTRFDEAASGAGKSSSGSSSFVEGPIKQIDREKVPKTPSPLIDGFEWCEMDLTAAAEMEEVRALLSAHYVEDGEALFRFNYSRETLQWALLAPQWRKAWHVGVRTSNASKKLVAFISAIPLTLRVKGKEISASEVNFMCVHKKLRSKRLAPVLITEITRRCYVEGVYQAIYTGGNLLPTPVASCRYYHRALDWAKLYGVGFSPLPHGSTEKRQIAKYKLPEQTSMPGLRPMEARDVDAVTDLLRRYLEKMEMSQKFSKEEVAHWMVDKERDPLAPSRVVWTYVVEQGGKIVDVVSFYCLESTIINNTGGHTVIRAAYLFYYATETAFQDDEKVLSEKLNGLVRDALILAKQAKFDVFNALTLLDNPMFLQKQLFGAGDGQLHYYLFNYKVLPVASGVDDKNQVDEKRRRGVGVVML